MRLRKFRHACLLLEEGDARLLFDPGSYSSGFEQLEDLTAVLVTHQHGDHLDTDRIRGLLERNPQARLYVDEGSAEQLELDATVVREGDELPVGGLEVRVLGREHAVIHPEIPVVPNVGYLVGGRFFHPGDALTVPDVPVDVLGVPAAAPWLKSSEAVDYLRQVAPRIAVPVHDAMLTAPGLYVGLLTRLAPEGTEVRTLDDGAPLEL